MFISFLLEMFININCCSHDEIGYYDLPVMIDQILKKSTYTKLYYAGASLGSTIYMVLCSERPEYQVLFSGSAHFGPAMWVPQWNMFINGIQIYLTFLDFTLVSKFFQMNNENIVHYIG